MKALSKFIGTQLISAAILNISSKLLPGLRYSFGKFGVGIFVGSGVSVGFFT